MPSKGQTAAHGPPSPSSLSLSKICPLPALPFGTHRQEAKEKKEAAELQTVPKLVSAAGRWSHVQSVMKMQRVTETDALVAKADEARLKAEAAEVAAKEKAAFEAAERARMQEQKEAADLMRKKAEQEMRQADERAREAERMYEESQRQAERQAARHAEELEIRDAFGDCGLEVWPMFANKKVGQPHLAPSHQGASLHAGPCRARAGAARCRLIPLRRPCLRRVSSEGCKLGRARRFPPHGAARGTKGSARSHGGPMCLVRRQALQRTSSGAPTRLSLLPSRFLAVLKLTMVLCQTPQARWFATNKHRFIRGKQQLGRRASSADASRQPTP